MAEFADIFIANDIGEATHYNIFTQDMPHITMNGLTDYELSALWASLTNSYIKTAHELPFIEVDSDDVLYQLPDEFTKALATLDESELITAAAIWAEYEEVHWRRPQAIEKLTEIRELAKQARQASKQLFLIIS